MEESVLERTILHVDCNKFYASVECLHRPEIRHLPVVVGGSVEERHGIILTKNEVASKFGIKTGEAIWQAKNKCPNLVVVPPNFPLYMRFSRLVREICKDYTDLIEPFGLDECWLDVSGSSSLFGDGEQIAQEIRKRVKFELGISVSIGVSYNKIFAKLGSDYKKPDAITVITKQNYKDLVWKLPANDLLYIGPATYKKLVSNFRYTIGDVANTDPEKLHRWFGKWGYIIHSFANGYDQDPVSKMSQVSLIKSIGNSTTTNRDLTCDNDVKMILFVLAESVARRMRDHGFVGSLIKISVRNNKLESFTRQHKIEFSTDITEDIVKQAFLLFKENYFWKDPIRSIGISVGNLQDKSAVAQISMFNDQQRIEKLERLDQAVDCLKRRYGNFCISRASLLSDPDLTKFNPYNDHVVHPVAYFKAQ